MYEDRDVTMAENDCFLTSSDEDVEDLSTFETERLQCLSKGGVEEMIGDASVNVEEFLCGNVDVEEDDGDKRQSMCLNVTVGGSVDVDDGRFSADVENNQILREDLGSTNVISTLKRAAWPIYSKKRSSVLNNPDKLVCKAVVFDFAIGSGTVGGVELPRGNVTDPSEGVPESFVTTGGSSALEGIARRQADESFVGAGIGGEGEGMVRIPPVEEMFSQEARTKERTKYYPSQWAKNLLIEFLELNPPTHLDSSHATTSFSVDQLIQFARAEGLDWRCRWRPTVCLRICCWRREAAVGLIL